MLKKKKEVLWFLFVLLSFKYYVLILSSFKSCDCLNFSHTLENQGVL